MWRVAEMDGKTAEGSSHMETFLERGILRNKKTFSAVFDRIFLKYEREFPEDEAGGKVLDFCGEDCEEQIEAIFGDCEDTDLGSKYQPIVIVDDDDSEIDSEDAALSALLHERVVKVKQEIDWDLEEQKLREKRREKELKLREEESSSDEESDSTVRAEVRWHRRNGRGKWAWPAPYTSSREMMSGPKNHVQGGDPQQLTVIDPNSQIITTVSVQPGLESEDPNDHDDTIAYPQHDNSLTLYPISQSLLDITGTCTTKLDGCESTDSISDVPHNVIVQNHQSFQNSCSLHQPVPLNKVVLAGSPPHGTRDSNNKSRRESEFLLSINSETNLNQPSNTSVYKPTLDKLPSHKSNATGSTLEDSDPSKRQQHISTRVKSFNFVEIESQSSTEEELLSGTVSEAEDSRRFSTRQPFSHSQSSTAVSEPKEDANMQATSQSESESELKTLPRPSRNRLGDDETGEELLLSGYESGYVDTRTQTSTHVSTLTSFHSCSSSSTPPPNDDIMTPPTSPERQEIVTSMPTTVELKPLTPVCSSPRREFESVQLTSTSPPLPPTCIPSTEARGTEVPENNATNALSTVASVDATERAANVESMKQDREIDQQHPPSATNEIGKDVSTKFAQDCDEATLNPDPAENDTANCIHQKPLMPSVDPSPSSDSLTETAEIAQNILSKTEDVISSCMCCPWQSPRSVCAHCPRIFSPCLSCTCHVCMYDHHCHSCIHVTSPKIGHTSSPQEEKQLYFSSHILSSNTSSPTTTNSVGHSQASSHTSYGSPCSPPPTTENHGEYHTHFPLSCCSHVCGSPISHTHSHNMHSPCACAQQSIIQEGSHTHPMSPCSSHILTTPSSCTCSALPSPPRPNNALSPRLFAMPSPQLMLPLNLKRSRDNSEDLSNSSGSEISSPPAKRHC